MSKRPKIPGITRNVASNIRHNKRIARIARQLARGRNRW